MNQPRPRMRYGRVYQLSGMTREMWQVGHPRYGRPHTIVGIFIGKDVGTRTWYRFEIHVGGQERGTISLPQEDLDQLDVTDLGAYWSDHADRARRAGLERGADSGREAGSNPAHPSGDLHQRSQVRRRQAEMFLKQFCLTATAVAVCALLLYAFMVTQRINALQ